MTKKAVSLLLILCLGQSCQFSQKEENKLQDINKAKTILWTPYNDSIEVVANADHEKKKLRYKFIQSKVLNKNEVFQPLFSEVSQFSFGRYSAMKPMVLEKDIPTIQSHIKAGKFSYEELVLFYLHRIYKYELPNETTLNTVIALNPFVLEEARNLDRNADGHHPIYGMPILLKDNIGTQDMRTTAGAIALMENQTNDAFVVERLKENGALILGKVNLSEWANFICNCPNGQSAIGGQTMNPYGRRQFDTGGSSAGSGTATAANYAVAAIGTETSGSILSPSGQNSVVGMKPTIGLLSRSGIVPISSTLDTPGPITKNVVDNAILLDAMLGKDKNDGKSVKVDWKKDWYKTVDRNIYGKRLGMVDSYLEKDSLYVAVLEKLKVESAKIIIVEPQAGELNGFLSILNIDMKNDLPMYIDTWSNDKEAVQIRTVEDVVKFNLQDSLVRIPYGQIRFDGILADTTSVEGLSEIKKRLKSIGRSYFDTVMDENGLDALLSINNYDAGMAAVAEYPALTIPMGYRESGEPVNLTFIAKPFEERKLYELGAAYEALTRARKLPMGYQD